MKTTHPSFIRLLLRADHARFKPTAPVFGQSLSRPIFLFLLILFCTFSLSAQDAQSTARAVSDEPIQEITDKVTIPKDTINTIESAYRFKGKFGADRTDSPFRSNEITDIQVVKAPDGMTALEDLLAGQDNWNWEQDLSRIQPKKDKVYWIKTRLIGNDFFSGEQILHVSKYGNDKEAFDYIDIYTAKNKGEYKHQRTGNAIPSKERPYDFWATFFKAELFAADTLDLYIRLEGLNRYFPMKTIHLSHIDPSSMFPRQIQEATTKWLIGGILGIQFVLFLCLFFIERDRIHFYFATHAFGILLMLFFTDMNYFTYIPFPDWYKYYPDILNLGVMFATVGFLKITETYFGYKADSVYSKKVIPGLLFLWLFFYMYMFFSDAQIFMGKNSFGSLLMLFCFLLSCKSQRTIQNVEENLVYCADAFGTIGICCCGSKCVDAVRS